ncbi:MAG: ribonuclease HI family protein [Candidatus Omnitrophica bacterium]|nr:ribonuclease HI family protein [Candidatus Omnitrophota bacterium]
MKELEIFTDGACSGNPGEAAIGFVINENNQRIKEFSKSIGKATNNIAEYTALIYALQEALILKADVIKVFTDSELMHRQIIGQYKVKNENIKLLFDQVKNLMKGFKKVHVTHVPREQNKDADRLASSVLKAKQTKMAASTLRDE